MVTSMTHFSPGKWGLVLNAYFSDSNNCSGVPQLLNQWFIYAANNPYTVYAVFAVFPGVGSWYCLRLPTRWASASLVTTSRELFMRTNDYVNLYFVIFDCSLLESKLTTTNNNNDNFVVSYLLILFTKSRRMLYIITYMNILYGFISRLNIFIDTYFN